MPLPGAGSITLQTNATPTTTNWVAYGGTITSSGSTNSVTLPSQSGSLYFRLFQQDK
ncbi:MAG TPA: hypothetical protein VMU04_05335 [Candidatus Acidoferrum sp.]|nr:hypothetical protein [Candidatus Acidoferrum sp.]